MRFATLKLASEPLTGTDRLLVLAIRATTDRRASDQPPPPTASKNQRAKSDAGLSTKGGCVEESVFAGLHRGEDPCKSREIRHSWAKTYDTGDGEISGLQAAAGTSARRREGVRRVRVRCAVVIRRIPRDKEPFSRTAPRLALSLAADHVPNKVVTGDPTAPAPADQGVVAPLIRDLATQGAVRVIGPNGHAEATAETDPK